MNVLSVVSFVMATGVLATAMLTATNNPKNFVDFHGFLVVIGGSIAATSMSFQLDRILQMFKAYWNRTILGRQINFISIIKDLIKLGEAYSNESPELPKLIAALPDHFMKECMQALVDDFSDGDDLLRMLRKRADTMFDRYSVDAQRFKAMGKYPPAMGLMGAVTGMIALLGSLGKPGAEKGIGPAMSVALVATLYGIALANFFIIPIGENLSDAAREMKRKNLIVIEGIKLIRRGTNALVLAEELNSFLLPAERIDPKTLK